MHSSLFQKFIHSFNRCTSGNNPSFSRGRVPHILIYLPGEKAAIRNIDLQSESILTTMNPSHFFKLLRPIALFYLPYIIVLSPNNDNRDLERISN